MLDDAILPAAAQAVAEVRNGTPTPLRRGPHGLLPLPEAVERFEFPAESRYAGHWARLLCNPPERIFRDLPEDRSVEALLLAVVREWSFLDPASPDHAPQPLPITEDGIGQVPGEAQLWLWGEWLERRHDPLLRKTPKPSPATPPASPS